VFTPVKQPAEGRALDVDTRTRNALLTGRWRALRHSTTSPRKIGNIVKAALTSPTTNTGDLVGGVGSERLGHRASAGRIMMSEMIESADSESSVADGVDIRGLIDKARAESMPLAGRDGLLSRIPKTVLETALSAELDEHLGYVKGDPAGRGNGNQRIGATGVHAVPAQRLHRVPVGRTRGAATSRVRRGSPRPGDPATVEGDRGQDLQGRPSPRRSARTRAHESPQCKVEAGPDEVLQPVPGGSIFPRA
jgi:hypothetical protein